MKINAMPSLFDVEAPATQPDHDAQRAAAAKLQAKADKHTAERLLSQKRDADPVTCSMFADFTPTDAAGNRSLF